MSRLKIFLLSMHLPFHVALLVMTMDDTKLAVMYMLGGFCLYCPAFALCTNPPSILATASILETLEEVAA